MSEQLTPTDVVELCAKRALAGAHVTTDQAEYPAVGAGDDVAGLRPAQLDRPNGLAAATVPFDQWNERIVTAAAVALAASAGRPANRGSAGQRGLWGLSATDWPQITDTMADDPDTATRLVFVITNRFADWGRWAGSAGLDTSSTAHQQATAAGADVLDVAGYVEQIRSAGGSVLGDLVPDWATGLARLIGNLLSPQWWRRLGIGAFGLLLLVIAVTLILAPEGTRP